MAGVHPHLILKLVAQLPQPLDAPTLARHLDRAFGPWGFALEDGKALTGTEALRFLLDASDLHLVDGTVSLNPARMCGRRER